MARLLLFLTGTIIFSFPNTMFTAGRHRKKVGGWYRQYAGHLVSSSMRLPLPPEMPSIKQEHKKEAPSPFELSDLSSGLSPRSLSSGASPISPESLVSPKSASSGGKENLSPSVSNSGDDGDNSPVIVHVPRKKISKITHGYRKIKDFEEDQADSFALNADGSHVVVNGSDGFLYVCDVKTAKGMAVWDRKGLSDETVTALSLVGDESSNYNAVVAAINQSINDNCVISKIDVMDYTPKKTQGIVIRGLLRKTCQQVSQVPYRVMNVIFNSAANSFVTKDSEGHISVWHPRTRIGDQKEDPQLFLTHLNEVARFEAQNGQLSSSSYLSSSHDLPSLGRLLRCSRGLSDIESALKCLQDKCYLKNRERQCASHGYKSSLLYEARKEDLVGVYERVFGVSQEVATERLDSFIIGEKPFYDQNGRQIGTSCVTAQKKLLELIQKKFSEEKKTMSDQVAREGALLQKQQEEIRRAAQQFIDDIAAAGDKEYRLSKNKHTLACFSGSTLELFACK